MPISRSQKDYAIDRILDSLKPNAYLDGHSHWEEARRSLHRLSYKALMNLSLLVICKTKPENDNPLNNM